MDELTKEEADLSLFSICCICWSLRYCQANTHLYSTDETSVLVGSYMNGIRSSRVVCQFPGLSSTLTCSCKCSTGPSGKPCPKSVRAAWTSLSPTMDLMSIYHLLNTNIINELSSQAKSNGASPLGWFLICFYTNEKTKTC